MEKKDKTITLLRQQLRKVLQENSAQKQGNPPIKYPYKKESL